MTLSFSLSPQLPLGTHAILDVSQIADSSDDHNATSNIKLDFTQGISNAEAPSLYFMKCSPDATLLIISKAMNQVIKPASVLKMRCDIDKKAWLKGISDRELMFYDGKDADSGLPTKIWFDIDDTRCLCVQGMRRGDGDKVAEVCHCVCTCLSLINFLELTLSISRPLPISPSLHSRQCVTCPDNTYAPINSQFERIECRACPRDGGVSWCVCV